MANNRNSRWQLSAILDFRKRDSWAMGRLRQIIFRLCTKFGAKSWSTPKLRPTIEIQDGGRPPSWNSCITIQDHPWSLFVGLHQPVKFCANLIQIWKYGDLNFFAELAWNAYLSPQNFGFCRSGPLKIIDHRRDPKRHICTWNHVLWALIHSIPSIFVTCRRDERICLCVCVCVCK